MSIIHTIKWAILNRLPDSVYLRILYKKMLGKPLNLRHPQTFNEKIQWLKLHDRKPEYTIMVDKYEVKKYVADKIGWDYIIPTLGVWDKFDDIDFDILPEQFVLKCTHDSGGLVICRDKSKFDIEAARKKINISLKTNYYLTGREWPYKNVKPRIIAEKYMAEEHRSDADLIDYKFMCFNGKVRCAFTCSDRFSGELKVTFFDINWNVLPFERHYPKSNKLIERPKQLDKMIEFSEKLAEKIPFLRTDFYEIKGRIYFGEITFYPGSGLEEFEPDAADFELGQWLKLPKQFFRGGGYWIDSENLCIWLHEECSELKSPLTKIKGSPIKAYLTDYKFYCFEGEPQLLYISSGLEDHPTASISFVNLNWTFASFQRNDYKPFNELPEKPSKYEEMLNICRILSNGHPFLRVDLYQISGTIYFSELTFYPCSGFMPFRNEKHDIELGKMLNIIMQNQENKGGHYDNKNRPL